MGIQKEVLLAYMDWYKNQVSYVANLRFATKPMESNNSSNDQTSFIVDRSYFDWQLYTIIDDKVNCSDTVRMVYNFNYCHYYSFRPPTNYTQKIRGMTVIFYLNDFVGARFNYINTDIALSQAAGIKLSVHAPGTGSKMSMAAKIGPGMEALVHLSQTKRIRLSAPHGTCINQLNQSSVEWNDGGTVSTTDTCYGLCMQQLFIDQLSMS